MDSSIDQQFIEYVVKSLVGKPEAVQVERRIDEKGVLLELTVDPEDLGRVIGKRGATAQSLRTLLRALGTKNEARYNLKIVDNGVGGPRADDAVAATPSPATQDDDADSTSDDVRDLAEDEPVSTKPASQTAKSRDDSSDAVARARAELAELDDLDV
jgi:predicted RNA-binding protein YlqC (UPF0109 family)